MDSLQHLIMLPIATLYGFVAFDSVGIARIKYLDHSHAYHRCQCVERYLMWLVAFFEYVNTQRPSAPLAPALWNFVPSAFEALGHLSP